jgi:hypothetical protein
MVLFWKVAYPSGVLDNPGNCPLQRDADEFLIPSKEGEKYVL